MHNIQFSIDISAFCAALDRNLKTLKHEKFFVTYKLPNGELSKSDVFTYNKTSWCSRHDLSIDLNTIRTLYTQGIDFSLYRMTKGSPTLPNANQAITDKDNGDNGGSPTNSPPMTERRKLLEILKSKNARVRHNPQILNMKAEPLPHHFDLPEKTLIPNIVLFNIQNPLKSRETSNSNNNWALSIFDDSQKEVSEDMKYSNKRGSDEFITVPYLRSSTPPLPHHFDVPEKHHGAHTNQSHNGSSSKPTSANNYKSQQQQQQSRLPQPHHSSSPDKIAKVKKQRTVENQEFITKFSIDPQVLFRNTIDYEFRADKPHEFLDHLTIKISSNAPLVNKDQKKELRMCEVRVSSIDHTVLIGPAGDKSLISLKMKFIDGCTYTFTSISDVVNVMLECMEMSDYMDSEVEFEVYLKNRMKGLQPRMIARARMSLKELLGSSMLEHKYTLDLHTVGNNDDSINWNIMKPLIKVKFMLAAKIEEPGLGGASTQGGKERYSSRNRSKSIRKKKDSFLQFNSDSLPASKVTKAIIHCHSPVETKQVLYVLQEANMKMLNYSIWDPSDVDHFNRVKMSPEDRARPDIITGIWMEFRQESFLVVESNILKHLLESDLRMLNVGWFLNEKLSEREYSYIEPKLFRIRFRCQDLDELMIKGTLYTQKNQMALKALNQLENIKQGLNSGNLAVIQKSEMDQIVRALF